MTPATTSSQAWTIVLAQFRAARNRLPRIGGAQWLSAAISLLWYGSFVLLAYLAESFLEQAYDPSLRETALDRGLLIAALYWQVAPLLLSASGASLDLKKLLAFPIRRQALFGIDLLLRLTTGAEPVIVTIGAAIGLHANPSAPAAAPLWLAAFTLWNLLLSIGLREAIARLMRRRFAREALTLAFLLLIVLPQLLVSFTPPARARSALAALAALPWPWTATAALASRPASLAPASLAPAAALLLWLAAAYAFARRQFFRGLAERDADAADPSRRSRPSLVDRLARAASAPFPDPLAALVEKEIRTLGRSSRFRLTFIMGFTFSVIIWLPMALRGDPDSFLAQHFAAFVTLYSVLLLGQVLFWNSFGFDRSGAALYFSAPVPIEAVFRAKNAAAAVLLFADITLALAACAAVRPPSAAGLAEAYSAAVVFAVVLLGAGNLTSVSQPFAVDPSSLFRSPTGRSVQLAVMVAFPLALLPIALAFLARYALDAAWAFYAVLAVDLGLGLIFYRTATQSAAERAHRERERLLSTLSGGSSPVA